MTYLVTLATGQSVFFFCCLVPILQAGDGACVGIYVNDLSSALVGSGVPL